MQRGKGVVPAVETKPTALVRPAGDAQARQVALLSPYLPRLVVDWVAANPQLPYQQVQGTLVFVDVSGFTKLSERLATHGKVGGEELASTIDACFAPLLDLAYANGGRLLKFGGDALLVLFAGTEHEVRACRAAFEMRASLRVVGRLEVLGHRVNLRMSVGINSGRFDMFLVGGSHRELIVAGPAASSTVAMEAAAEAGEILLGEPTASALSASDLGPAKAGGRLLRRIPRVTTSVPTPQDPVETLSDLSTCIPTALIAGLLGSEREPEHRRAVVAFIHFDGTDAMLARRGAGETAAYLDRIVRDVQAAVEAHDVTFLGSDVDRDGGKIILVAGAPSTSGDDEQRMLLALHQIMDLDREPPLRVGVNRGPVFAGDIGPAYRRTFTVMGDTVNLAARLMAKARPNTVLATPEVVARSRSSFDAVAVEPFMVKGKARPIEAVEVGALRRAGVVEVGAGDLVGRRQELATWEAAVQAARGGSGFVIEVVGEPGVGKSRLLQEFCARAEGVELVSTTCEDYEASVPYGTARTLVRRLLGLEGSDLADLAASLLEKLRAVAPDLLPWAPLVAAVIDADVPPTPETAELDPQFWAPRLREVVTQLLAAAVVVPTALIVEDTHWMDEASAELLGQVCDVVPGRPWIVCSTRRDVETGFLAPEETATRLRLGPLQGEEAIELAERSARGVPLLEREMAVLVERSGGNPLFLRELVAAAREAEDLDSLPDSVEAVIAARIDRLSLDDRQLLRRVSVLGRGAPVPLLGAVLDEVPAPDDPVWARVGEFLSFDGQGALVFGHALVRDSAYDAMSYRLRRKLHARVGDAIRAAAEPEPEEQSDLLSLHYLHAQRYDEAWTFALTAAARALAVHANADAAGLFERALAAGRKYQGLPGEEMADVYERLGDARDRTSEYQRAAAAYRSARALRRAEPLANARLMLKLARVQGWLDRYSTSLRWITRALRTLEGSEDLEAQRQRAQLLAWYGRFAGEQGHHARAITWCERAVAQAEQVGEKEALANALSVLDWAQMDLGRLEYPANSERALALMEDLGDLQGQGRMFNFLGLFAHQHGRWDEAVDLYGRAQDMARRVGNAVQLAMYENNMAELALHRGHVAEAGRIFKSAARTCRAAGHRSAEAYAKCNVAWAASRSGHFDEAMGLFEESWHEAEALGSHAESMEVGVKWAECELLAGGVEAARVRVERERQRARAMGGVAEQMPLLDRIRGVTLARAGDWSGAAEALRASLDAALHRGSAYEAALTKRVMAPLGFEHGGQSPDEMARESERTLASLGVVWVPDLLQAAPGHAREGGASLILG